jgi:hypothetical protein
MSLTMPVENSTTPAVPFVDKHEQTACAPSAKMIENTALIAVKMRDHAFANRHSFDRRQAPVGGTNSVVMRYADWVVRGISAAPFVEHELLPY